MFGVDDAALAMIGSGLIGSAGSIYVNSQNQKLQKALNSLSIDLSNSAHQREVLDLQAAGLNPILSASSSGAAVPQLTAPDLSNPGEGLSSGLSSAGKIALQSRSVGSQIAVNSAQAANLLAQNDNLHEQNKEIQARVDNIKADTALKKEQKVNQQYPGVVGNSLRTLNSFTRDVGNSASSWFKSSGHSAKSVGLPSTSGVYHVHTPSGVKRVPPSMSRDTSYPKGHYGSPILHYR